MQLDYIDECGMATQEKFIEGGEDMQARFLQVLCVWEVAQSQF